MSSSSPYAQQSSDQEHVGGGETSEDDGEAIEVDPLTFCQPEMSSGGQGEFEESFEEQESEDDINGHEQIEEHILRANENDSAEEEQKEYNTVEEISEQSNTKVRKIPSVQLTVVNKKRDKPEKTEKENGSGPKVTITAIGSTQNSSVYNKEGSPINISKKRKLDNEFDSSMNGIEPNLQSSFYGSNHVTRYDPVLDHPIELRKLLFGDLAQEMCITVSRPGTNWQKVLSPLDFDPDSPEVHRFSFERNSSGNRVLNLLRQHGDSARSSATHNNARSNFSRNNIVNPSAISPEPAPLLKEDPPLTTGITQSQLEEAMASGLLTDFFASHSAFGGGADTTNATLRGASLPDANNSKPPAKYNRDLIDPEKGIFEDPETGTIRYRCRNDCGVTLASAKGRRKHERRHCPKSSGEDREVSNSSQQSLANRYPSSTSAPLLVNSSNVAQPTIARSPSVSKTNSGFKCRFCGQLLTTLEGCKLHEKIQHANEISLSAAAALSAAVNSSNMSTF